jgi:hypothetical protein
MGNGAGTCPECHEFCQAHGQSPGPPRFPSSPHSPFPSLLPAGQTAVGWCAAFLVVPSHCAPPYFSFGLVAVWPVVILRPEGLKNDGVRAGIHRPAA